MTNFKRPKPRFDRDIANDGRWFYIDDSATGEEYGGFLCGLFDVSIPRVRQIAERVVKAQAYQSRNKRPSDFDKNREHIETFVEACVFDWDMKDADDKPIKFSKALAVDYFLTSEIDERSGDKIFVYDYVFQKLVEICRDVTQFQSEAQNAAGDAAKNS